MAIKNVLFDLDGTLLPIDQDNFTKSYFKYLSIKAEPFGFKPEVLIKAVWAGTAAMVKNDGKCTNEQVFWNAFASIFGEEVLKYKPIFDEFYSNEFQNAKEACGFAPQARETVDMLKAKGVRTVLATNPIFPAVATESRIRWAGLEPSDFELYTTYESCHFCKPNPKYYLEIAEKLGMEPSECLMVGNDVKEDMVAKTVGMSVFLLTDCLINKDNEDISRFPHGGFCELKKFLNNLL